MPSGKERANTPFPHWPVGIWYTGDMFDTELKYFIANQDALVAKHRGRTLVIRGQNVEGVYDSVLEAYLAAQRQFPVGTFMIQPCESGPRAYTVTLSSMNW